MVSDRVADYRANTYQAFRSKGIKARKAVSKPSFVRQLKALVASKKREAADVARTFTVTAATTKLECLTSTTSDATAASGTGLFDCDADEVLINHVRIKGRWTLDAEVDADLTGWHETYGRKLVVWFNKPLLVASTGGTMPPITEVLIADTIESLPVTAAANGGRFTILSDKKWNLGNNAILSAAAHDSHQSGVNLQYFDYTVKVNKVCKFKAAMASGGAGGHYDSDVAAGQVDRGLLVCYTMAKQPTNGDGPVCTCATRLNYTG